MVLFYDILRMYFVTNIVSTMQTMETIVPYVSATIYASRLVPNQNIWLDVVVVLLFV